MVLLPWLLQVANTPPGHIPTGFVAGGEDYNTYIAKMKWGTAGNWTYPNRYTPEPTEAVPIYGFFLLLGHISAWTGVSLQWVFHLSKAVLGGLALYALWLFISKNTSHPGIAFLLAVGASGGYLNSRAELFIQGHLYLSLLTFPHYLISLLAYLAIFHAYLFSDIHPCVRAGLAAVGGFFLSATHPFLLALVLVVPVVHALLFNRPALKRALVISITAMVAALPLVLILARALLEAPWLNAWREQTSSTGIIVPVFLVTVYGLAGVLGWIRVPFVIRKSNDRETFWAVWLVMAALFAVAAPLPNRREFAFFLSLPLGLLASVPVAWFLVWLKGTDAWEWSKKSAVVLVLFLGVWYAAGVYFSLAAPVSREYAGLPHYLPKEYLDGMAWLDGHAKEGDVSMVLPETGNLIPAWTLRVRPYVGHPSETLDYQEKKARVGEFFFGNMSCEDALAFIRQSGVRWVVFDHIIPEKKGNYEFLLGVLGSPGYENDYLTFWEVAK